MIDVVRMALRGDPVCIDGATTTLPRPGGIGKALRFAQLGEPLDVPIFVAAMGARNVELTAELADGWIPFPWAPVAAAAYEAHLASGRRARAPGLSPLVLAPTVSVGFGDVVRLRRMERASIAFSLRGHGSAGAQLLRRRRRPARLRATARTVQRAWLAGDHDGARRAVADELIDAVSILGDVGLAERRLV